MGELPMNSTIDTSWRGIRRRFLEVLGVWVPVAFLFFGKAGGWFEGMAFLGLCAMAMFDDSGERRWSSWRLWGGWRAPHSGVGTCLRDYARTGNGLHRSS